MTYKQFEERRKQLNEECEKILVTKGREYTDGGDRLSNFKQFKELSPLVVWFIYFMKHINAINYAVIEGKTLSESLESRFIDARNYIDLGLALFEELTEENDRKGKLKDYGIG